MLSKWLRSFFRGSKAETVVVAGDKSYPVPEERPVSQLKPIIHRPWPNAEYHFVGFSRRTLKGGKVVVGMKFYDPVTKKEFTLNEGLANLLMYRE